MNRLAPKATAGYNWDEQDRGVTSAAITAHFGDVASAAEKFLADSETVVGCVAWFTSPRLVRALAGKRVALIVNKEWTLRTSDRSARAVRNRATLAGLTGGLNASAFPEPLRKLGGKLDAVRCAGHNPRGTRHPGLMHSKFFIRMEGRTAVAVWTGSFNATVGAESNIENAVEIHDPAIATAYLHEFARIAAISEPMEFSAGAAKPTWKRSAAPKTTKPAAKKTPSKAKPKAKTRARPRRTNKK